MGQWSHRRRRGGGQAAPAALIQINSAVIFDVDVIHVNYSGDVTAPAFDLTDFQTVPDSHNPDNITNFDSNTLELTFPLEIDDQTNLAYAGDAPGILTPQTVLLT